MIKSLQNSVFYFSKFSKKGSQVRVRYAPSPTGDVHLGGLRTALYNYLYAKKHKGKFILRIEDTDKNREVDGSINQLLDVLKWCNINPEEGPQIEGGEIGQYGPYQQSKRLDIYKQYAQKLVESGDAYYCFCSADRLKQVREQQQKNKQLTQYDKHCLSLSQEEIKQKLQNNESHVIRLNVREGETSFEDMVHGNVTFNHKQVDDQVLIKSDGYPTYHLANVVDDYLMKITHVIRGEEWLTSTPKHILLYDALNLKHPKFAHLPLLVNPNGKKLSKRQEDQSVQYFRDNQIQPESLLNFIGLLGWSPMVHDELLANKGKLKLQDQLLSLEDMEDMFSMERVRNRNSVVDKSVLLQFNGYYLKQKYHFLFKDEDLFNEFMDLVLKQLPSLQKQIKQTSTENLVQIFQIILERIQILSDIQNYTYFWQKPTEFNQSQQKKFFKDKEKSSKIIKQLVEIIESQQHNWNKDDLNKQLGMYLFSTQQTGQPLKNEDVYHFLRFLLTGNKNGPAVGEICEILGYKETQNRVYKWYQENK